MDLREFEAIGKAYRETWEKARLTVLALGGEFPLPWDAANAPKPKYNSAARVGLANSLNQIINNHGTKKTK